MSGRVNVLANIQRPTMTVDVSIVRAEMVMSDGVGKPPPGWYESENGSAYWDGETWHVRRADSAPEDGDSLFSQQPYASHVEGASSHGASSDHPVKEAFAGFVILSVAGFVTLLVLGFFGIFGFSIFGWTVSDLTTDQREIACIESGGTWSAGQDHCFPARTVDAREVACIQSGGNWNLGRCSRPLQIPQMGGR